MRKTFVYIISILFFLSGELKAQDTISYPLRFSVGIEALGPAIYYSNKNVQNIEGYVSMDLDEKKALSLSIGHLNYQYSQYNYSYLNKGEFVRLGVEFNLLKPEKALGKYWAGIGLRYGLSRYTSETPSLTKENYWGTRSSSVAERTNWGHFVEVTPGVRAQMFKGFSMGWSVSMRLLVHAGGSHDLKPIYLPGFGNATKSVSPAISYFLVWNIHYKQKTVITKKEEPEPEDEEDDVNKNSNGTLRNNSVNNSNRTNPGYR
jgi:hypothetical protein